MKCTNLPLDCHLDHWELSILDPSRLQTRISIWTLMARSGFHELSCLTFMVANYCFPLSWPSSTQRTELRKTPSVHFSFSIHPRIVNSSSSSNLQQYLTDLEYLIKSSRTVAVGECGLDNTAKSLQLDKQIKKNQRNYQLSYTVAEMNHSTVFC